MLKTKKGFFSFKAVGTSVSGIVVIVGAFCIWLSVAYNKPNLLPTGITFVGAGLAMAFIMTLIIKYG